VIFFLQYVFEQQENGRVVVHDQDHFDFLFFQGINLLQGNLVFREVAGKAVVRNFGVILEIRGFGFDFPGGAVFACGFF